MAEFSLKKVYFLGLKNLVADAFSRLPGVAGFPDDIDIEKSSSGPRKLQDPIILAAMKDWLQVVAPHLVLTNCMGAIKTALPFGHSVVALACKRCSRQYLDHGEYAT